MAPMAALLIALTASSLIAAKRITRAGKGQEGGILP